MIFDGHLDWSSEDLSAFGGFLKPQIRHLKGVPPSGDPENW